jgi:UDP-2-acetamido-2,6-beta-L-arabino-hexul-4-ose reductase
MIKIIKLRKFIDERGSLIENTDLDVMQTSKHFFVSKSKPGVIRGNHYHKKKIEWFYVIQGKCKIVIKDLLTEKMEEKIINDSDNVLINMKPNQVHAFQNIGNNEMILLALVNEVLDHDRPDTYFYKIL